MLARAFCTYTVLDGAAVPARKRRGFAEMAIARWSPFADVQSHVEWVGDRAMVWAWSKSRIEEGDDVEARPPPRRVWPESLFRGQPKSEGEELVALEEGFEGRVWRDGVMTASCWWPAVPALDEWNEFRRGAGLPPASAHPVPVETGLGDRAWTAPKAIGVGEAFGRYGDYLALAAVGVGTAVVCALLVGVLALKVSTWQLEREIAEREQSLERIINARDRALTARAAIDVRLALRPPAGQVELLALVGSLMAGNWQLVEWKAPDAQSLEVTARMANPDPRAIVSAWEASRRFSGVTAEIGRQPDTVVVKARVLRTRTGQGKNK
ncbi:MAG: hypothetical protein EOP93_00425 [Lysobacteraceae bacterium]|nr:MAG: hypothetical protein EOP93_00425 [Xanthomonadaceae bacterium]